jgi:amidase
MTQACDLGALEARRLIGNRQLSPVELLDSCLQRLDKVNPTLNAVVAIDRELAQDKAAEDEQAVMNGEDLGLLHGLPVGIKDLEPVAGLRTTFGSLLFEHHVPDNDNRMVAGVRTAGGNIFCKTNVPEFGAGANTRNRVYGATGNPFDPVKTCGGSSGGSAVALATGMLPLATGSDYGGSLRTPAGFCGVVGFRPSPGLVASPDGAVSLSPFGVLGPMGRTVEDAHLLLQAQLKVDKRDPWSNSDIDMIADTLTGVDLGSLRVAISTDLGCSPVENNIREVFSTKVNAFSHHFAESFERHPFMENIHECFEILRCVNFVAAHGDELSKHRDLLGPNVIDNTERGKNYTLADVAWANRCQSEIYRHFVDFFDDADVLICPVAAVSPFPHASWSVESINDEAMPTYMRWLSLSYALTTALPSSCAIPCGTDHLGMPFGIQVVGPNGSDALVLEVAHSLEKLLATNPETARPIAEL